MNYFIKKFKYKFIEEKTNKEEENKELEVFKNKELLNNDIKKILLKKIFKKKKKCNMTKNKFKIQLKSIKHLYLM